VLAHFALGNLARSCGRNDTADKHFSNASRLLAACPADDVLPESDGLTVGRLTEIISSITALGIAP
jgi:chemotaxis protein methyltransferase CheR